MISLSIGLLYLRAWLQRSSRMATAAEKKRPLYYWKATNFAYEDSPHPLMKLRFPGLSHESFDRDMKPKITSIMMTSAVARATALRRPIRVVSPNPNLNEKGPQVETFLDFSKLSNDYFPFMSSAEFVMSPAMYDNTIPKWLLDMKFTQGFVGNSSVANVSQFYACDEKDKRNASDLGHAPLWTNTFQVVMIDKTTRKPSQLPDWFKEKYKGKGCMEKGFILKTFTRPAVTFSLPFKVQWTDTDQYNHTNFTTYVRWALDASHAALRVKGDPQNKPNDEPGAIKRRSDVSVDPKQPSDPSYVSVALKEPSDVSDDPKKPSDRNDLLHSKRKTSDASDIQSISSASSDAKKRPNDVSDAQIISSAASDIPKKPSDVSEAEKKRPSAAIDADNKPKTVSNGTNDEQSTVWAALPYINRDMLAQGLHKLQVTYLKECLEGECVEIHLWQEEGGEKELVLFSVVKNGEDVCQMRIWYFPVDEEF